MTNEMLWHHVFYFAIPICFVLTPPILFFFHSVYFCFALGGYIIRVTEGVLHIWLNSSSFIALVFLIISILHKFSDCIHLSTRINRRSFCFTLLAYYSKFAIFSYCFRYLCSAGLNKPELSVQASPWNKSVYPSWIVSDFCFPLVNPTSHGPQGVTMC